MTIASSLLRICPFCDRSSIVGEVFATLTLINAEIWTGDEFGAARPLTSAADLERLIRNPAAFHADRLHTTVERLQAWRRYRDDKSCCNGTTKKGRRCRNLGSDAYNPVSEFIPGISDRCHWHIAKQEIAEIRDAVNLVVIVNAYTELRLTGGKYLGLCPFHSETTPSFTLDSEHRALHCFGCGWSGNIFNFLEKVEHITYKQAIELAAGKITNR